MEPIYSLAFTFFLLTNQSDHTAHQHTIPIHAEREIAYYDREGGGPVKSMDECRAVAARRKERAEDAIRNSPKKLFADHVEVTCFEYERPKGCAAATQVTAHPCDTKPVAANKNEKVR